MKKISRAYRALKKKCIHFHWKCIEAGNLCSVRKLHTIKTNHSFHETSEKSTFPLILPTLSPHLFRLASLQRDNPYYGNCLALFLRLPSISFYLWFRFARILDISFRRGKSKNATLVCVLKYFRDSIQNVIVMTICACSCLGFNS